MKSQRRLWWLLALIGVFTLVTWTILNQSDSASPKRGSIKEKVVQKEFKDEKSYLRSIEEIQAETTVEEERSCHLTSETKADLDTLNIWDNLVEQANYSHYWTLHYSSFVGYEPEKVVAEPKLKVFVVPFSHVDPGWLRTYTDYTRETDAVLTNLLNFLSSHREMTFMWTEISFFQKWWDRQTTESQTRFKQLVANGQVDFTTTSWTMTDEASPYYWATIDNMIEGHQYVYRELGVKPTASWSCDPFGYGTTVPYLFRKANVTSLVINRIHRVIKTFLAKRKELDFNWRQYWDPTGKNDMFTSVLRGGHYDVPSTCGPDPHICCQFDFRRIDMHSCPGPRPVEVTQQNVAERAQMLYDQYRKLAQTTQHNVLLVPLGDDFRYTDIKEFSMQYDNYQQLFAFMNGKQTWNVQARFGTFTDYFRELNIRKRPAVPSFSGDFFPYSDMGETLWTGYFSSRAFHKKMDRLTQSALRSASLISTLALANVEQKELRDGIFYLLKESRRDLALFQHHDAITGTSKAFVMEDYAIRLWSALNKANLVSSMSAQLLMSKSLPTAIPRPKDVQPQLGAPMPPEWGFSAMVFDVNEKPTNHSKIAQSIPLVVQKGVPTNVLLFNSLPFYRREIVRLITLTPNVLIQTVDNEMIPAQVNPVFAAQGVISSFHYEVAFIVNLPPLGIQKVTLVQTDVVQPSTVIASVYTSPTVSKATFPNAFKVKRLPSGTYSMRNRLIQTVHDSETGLMKGVIRSDGQYNNLAVDFWLYQQTQSGAYIFAPTSVANKVIGNATIHLVEGPVMSESHLVFTRIRQTITVSNFNEPSDLSLSVRNEVDLSRLGTTGELVMRVHSGVDNEDRVFYTDANGFQIIQRVFRPTKKMETNYFPMAASVILEDRQRRLTVFSGQPHGVTSPIPGVVELMLDRTTVVDDGKGLGEGVQDNSLSASHFKILLESLDTADQDNKNHRRHLAHSLLGNHLFQSLLYPPVVFHEVASHEMQRNSFSPLQSSFLCDVQLLDIRSLDDVDSLLIVHRQESDCRLTSPKPYGCQKSGKESVAQLLNVLNTDRLQETSLTSLYDLSVQYESSEFEKAVEMDPMDIRSFRIVRERRNQQIQQRPTN